MKRDLHKLVTFIAMLFLPLILWAQYVDPAYGIRIDESFEKGIPADWIQENVSGSINWVVESQNLTNPTGAADSLARIAFRNTSGVTTKAVTRLILPAVDVASLFQPVLIFSHAQDKWSGDFDTLRILCRTSADGEWITLTIYDNYIAKWQRDTIFLPTATYCQIAFEATDNLGRGVVIDDVVVRSTPSCFDPEDLYTSKVTNNSIIVNWMGSFDAEYFYVKLSTKPLSAEELESSATELVCDTTTNGVTIDFTNLIQGTKYYCYVRSQCEHEISDWAFIEFKTANLISIPDTITFNLPNDPNKKGQPAYIDGWYHAAAKDGYKPYINAYANDDKYCSSPDGTSCLSFTYTPKGLTAYDGALPAEAWAYVATPEINYDVKDLQITFESLIYYKYVADQFGITVGVMTDPEDRSTFVPIETIINEDQFICQEYTVSFENYTGNGKYIAFMSDFSKSNHFNIDNLIIEPRKELPSIQFDIMMPTASELQFKFDKQYDSYEVVISNNKHDIDRSADFPNTLNILSKYTIANMGKVENLTPDARYYVYARAIKGDKKSRWSRPRFVEMPSRFDNLPYTFDFEKENMLTSIDMNGYSNAASIPQIIKPLFTYFSRTYAIADSTAWVKSNYRNALPLSAHAFEIGCYYTYNATTIAVFPEVDMTTTKVAFYAAARLSSESMSTEYDGNIRDYRSVAYVGVMTDANDMNSFVAVDTIEPSLFKYTYYEYDFSTFPEVQGARFFAIKMGDLDYIAVPNSRPMYTNLIHLDNMTFSKSLDCKSPTDMEAEVDLYDPSKAIITWNANGVVEWNVKVATTEYNKDQFGVSNTLDFVYEGKVTIPKVELTGLKYPNQTYYYWLQPICEGVVTDWTIARSFETFCPALHSLPYVQNFDDAEAGSNVWTGFAVSCMYAKQWTRNIPNATPSGHYKNKYYYPYVSNRHSYNGENSLPIFRKYSASYRNYIALPEFDKSIDSLQLTFRLYSEKELSVYWKYQELAIGVMSDPMDINTFEQVALVTPSKYATWERIVVKFEEYKGRGKYIAIRETDKFTSTPEKTSSYTCGTNTDSVYIDNIEVNIAPLCDIPYGVFASDVTPNSAKLNWKSDAESFVVIVTDKEFAYADLMDFEDYKAGTLSSFANAASVISVDTIVGAKSMKVSELTFNKDYYVYIKGFCQGLYTDYTEGYNFSTYCPSLPVESFLGDFTDAVKDQTPDCWFVGKTSGEYTTGNTILSYISVASSSSLPDQGNYVKIISTNGALNSTTQKPTPNGVYVTCPNVNVDDITKYKVKFSAWTTASCMYTDCGSNDYARAIIVGVVTNPYDMSTFVPMDTIENIHINPYPYEVYLNDYVCDLNGDTGKFISFYSNFGLRNQVQLDDVEFELIDNCPRFNGEVESTTPSSVTIKFESVPTSYEVKASTSLIKDFSIFENDTLNLYPSTIGTSNVITIENLRNHREYFFYARSTADTICNEWKLVLHAYPADYEEREIPFFDNFEDNKLAVTYGACPHDWCGLYSEAHLNDKSYPSTTTISKTGGTRSASLYGYSGKDTYLVSPKLKVDKLNNCYLEYSFYHNTISSYPQISRALTVGVVSDVNNIETTFEPLDTFIITPENMGLWLTDRIELTSYTGTAKHVAFRVDGDLNKSLFSAYPTTIIYVDDVIVDYIPKCYTPNTCVSKTITDKAIEVSFSHVGALQYEALYALHGLITDPDSVTSNDFIKYKLFSGTEFTIDSLSSESSYDVYVRAICTEKDTSDWVFAGTYTTLPSIISEFPYFNGFEDVSENANWKYHSTSGYNWYMGVDEDSLVADKKNSTDAALYYSNDGGKSPLCLAGKSGNTAKAYRYIELKEGTYSFSFDWVCPSKPNVTTSQAIFDQNLCRVFLMPATVTFSSAEGFKTVSGQSMSLTYIDPLISNMPDGFYDLSNHIHWGKEYGALFGTDLSLPLDQQWQRRTYNLTITKETEGTYMLLFFMYCGPKADVTAEGYRAAVIDNLSIVKSECGSVTNIAASSATTTSVQLSWAVSDNSITNFDVCVLNAEVDPDKAIADQKVFITTANTTSATVTGLNPFTTYYVYVRPNCTSENNPWGDPIEFKTLPDIPDGYTFSFEEEELLYCPKYTNSYLYELNGDDAYDNKETKFHQWLTRSMIEANNTSPKTYAFNKNYAKNYPQVAQDTIMSSTQYLYGRTGKRALWLGSRTTSAYMNGATVALPYAGDFDGKRLIFYMRPFASKQSATSVITREMVSLTYPYYTTTVALNNQSRKITVGTMTDPNDATTFVPLDTVMYPYSNTDYGSSTYFDTKDVSGDKGWHRVVLSLKEAKGKYIAFRYEWYGTATLDKTVNMYIDDVTIETIPECPAPELMQIASLKGSSVTINYSYETENPTTDVMVALDESFRKVVSRDTFNTLPFTVTGLQPLTKYYVRVNVLCSDLDVSNYSRTLQFETPVDVCYENNFDAETTHYPENWLHSFNPSFDGVVKGTSTTFSWTTPASANTWGWKLKDALFANGKFSSAKHLAGVPSGQASASSTSLWALSPVIAMDETADQHLSFDLALTEKGTNNAVDFSMMTSDTSMVFAVFVFDMAEGHVYRRENTTIWKTPASKMYDYDFTAIPQKGAEYSIDLNQFKGKNIQVALVYASTQQIDLHIDNFHINTYTTKEYEASICEFCDYEDNDFFVLSSNTELGKNEFSKWYLESENPDTLLVLNLNVNDAPEINTTASMCAGDVYNGNGFTGLVQEGVYRRKFISKNGCDSIVSLALTVTPTVYTTVIDTVCWGTKYSFNGKEYDRTGIYVDTLVSVVTGCDSVVTLALSVSDVKRTEQYVNICYGETYTFGSQTISATGKYEELFKTAEGCDSLVTLHATMLPEYKTVINAVIKEGEEYNESGFRGLTESGEYELSLKSVDGCDSTVILTLKVLDNMTNEVSMNICFGDSYVFGSQTITTSGQYVEVFKSAEGGDSTVVLTVTVLPDYRQSIEATICAGEVYNEYGFKDLNASGVYTQDLKSVDGCDSTITLKLTVLSGDTTRVEFRITTDQLPYEYQSLYYDKSTLPGTYVDTIVVETENCEEVIIHTLIVDPGVAVDNVNSYDLVMVPNPVAVNGTLYINAEFTPEERDGLVVEVFNAIGQRVYVEYPSIYPIEVTGLAERGMYIVRIIAGNGKSYQGKIIVE